MYRAFAISILRTMLKVAGGALVARGLVEDGLMQDVAAGAAIVIVTAMWDFWRIYRRQIYQNALVFLGLQEQMAETDEGKRAQAERIFEEAKSISRAV
jgi:ABC-type nickel/cobalt efflux system permease component RcnA